MTLHLICTPRCAWCDAAFTPNRVGRPKVYCGPICRQAAARYLERLPAWRAELAELEAAAAAWRAIRKPVPVATLNEIDAVRRLIDRGPRGEPR